MSIRSKISKLFEDAKAIALELYDQHFGPEMIEGTELVPIQVKLADVACEFTIEVRPKTRSRVYALKSFMDPGVVEVTSIMETLSPHSINRICPGASIDASYWNTDSKSGMPCDCGEASPEHPLKISFKMCATSKPSDMLNMVAIAAPSESFAA